MNFRLYCHGSGVIDVIRRDPTNFGRSSQSKNPGAALSGGDKTRVSLKTARYSRQAIQRSKTCDPRTNGPAPTYLADYGAQPVSDTGVK